MGGGRGSGAKAENPGGKGRGQARRCISQSLLLLRGGLGSEASFGLGTAVNGVDALEG